MAIVHYIVTNRNGGGRMSGQRGNRGRGTTRKGHGRYLIRLIVGRQFGIILTQFGLLALNYGVRTSSTLLSLRAPYVGRYCSGSSNRGSMRGRLCKIVTYRPLINIVGKIVLRIALLDASNYTRLRPITLKRPVSTSTKGGRVTCRGRLGRRGRCTTRCLSMVRITRSRSRR